MSTNPQIEINRSHFNERVQAVVGKRSRCLRTTLCQLLAGFFLFQCFVGSLWLMLLVLKVITSAEGQGTVLTYVALIMCVSVVLCPGMLFYLFKASMRQLTKSAEQQVLREELMRRER